MTDPTPGPRGTAHEPSVDPWKGLRGIMAGTLVLEAIVIGLVFGSITLVLWEGAVDVAAGRLSGGSIAAFVLTGGIVAVHRGYKL